MSYTSQLEKHARISIVMSLLNELRHRMQGRTKDPLSDEDTSILREALEFSQKKTISGKMLHYSFRGLGKRHESAAVQLSDTIYNTLKYLSKDGDSLPYIETLFEYIQKGSVDSEEGKKLITKFTVVAMDIIDDQTRDISELPFNGKVI